MAWETGHLLLIPFLQQFPPIISKPGTIYNLKAEDTNELQVQLARMTSTLPKLGLLSAGVVTEPDRPVSGLSHFNDIAQELQVYAFDDDLHTINLTMESSFEDLQSDTNWKQYMLIQCRDTYTVLASSLRNIASALKITNSYPSRGTREY